MRDLWPLLRKNKGIFSTGFSGSSKMKIMTVNTKGQDATVRVLITSDFIKLIYRIRCTS